MIEFVTLAQTTEPPGQKPLVVNGVVVGPFEEREKGSDVVKVKGDDPANPRLSEGGQGEEVRRQFSIMGACNLVSLVRKPRDRNDSPISVE